MVDFGSTMLYLLIMSNELCLDKVNLKTKLIFFNNFINFGNNNIEIMIYIMIEFMLTVQIFGQKVKFWK